jgi:hypothetical protein
MSRQEDEKKKERNFGVIHSYFPSPATFFNNMHSRSDYDFLFSAFFGLGSSKTKKQEIPIERGPLSLFFSDSLCFASVSFGVYLQHGRLVQGGRRPLCQWGTTDESVSF